MQETQHTQQTAISHSNTTTGNSFKKVNMLNHSSRSNNETSTRNETNNVLALRNYTLTLSVREPHLCLNANRLDPGQPPSNSAAGLRSNLFAT